MSIQGLDIAIEMAIDRANRSKDIICVVQIGKDEYVLWRHNNIKSVPLTYKYYKIVKTIRINRNDIR